MAKKYSKDILHLGCIAYVNISVNSIPKWDCL